MTPHVIFDDNLRFSGLKSVRHTVGACTGQCTHPKTILPDKRPRKVDSLLILKSSPFSVCTTKYIKTERR